MIFPAPDPSLSILLAVITIAGIARGLTGFGTGMIVAPVAGALYGPKAALVIIVIIDSLPSLPVTLPAFRIARWSEVLPVTLGVLLLFPAGIYILSTGDPLVLRWIISIMVLGCVAILWNGWSYAGPRNAGVSLGVGSVAGILSGIAAIPGPPVIAYWMASGLPAALVRANLLVLFFLTEFVSVANLWFAGLFERTIVLTGLIATPFYFFGLVAGARCFGLAGERSYRIATFGLIILAAVLTLPVLDKVFCGAHRTVRKRRVNWLSRARTPC